MKFGLKLAMNCKCVPILWENNTTWRQTLNTKVVENFTNLLTVFVKTKIRKTAKKLEPKICTQNNNCHNIYWGKWMPSLTALIDWAEWKRLGKVQFRQFSEGLRKSLYSSTTLLGIKLREVNHNFMLVSHWLFLVLYNKKLMEDHTTQYCWKNDFIASLPNHYTINAIIILGINTVISGFYGVSVLLIVLLSKTRPK